MKTPLLIFSVSAALGISFPASAAAQAAAPEAGARPVVAPGDAGSGTAVRPASPAIDLTPAEIASRGALYAGRKVTVASTVEEFLTPWAMLLDEDQVLAGGIDNDMLVIGAEPLLALGVDRSWLNREVRVTGTVRILQAEDFRREYGRGVDDRLFRRFEGKPALIAASVTPAGPAQGGGSAAPPATRDGSSGAGASGDSGISAECRPSSMHCPVTGSSGSVTTTDSLPLGSAPARDRTITESQYPTSPGSGSVGSGTTGVPAGPAPGPVLGIGR